MNDSHVNCLDKKSAMILTEYFVSDRISPDNHTNKLRETTTISTQTLSLLKAVFNF